ncbi:oligomeric, coiled-coil, peripheral membrane protein [Apophysomyces sp. BC1034]|nr:oligomeric, coiled-coil, peripheral membrane protein [Apophysomyces sp. BC1034]
MTRSKRKQSFLCLNDLLICSNSCSLDELKQELERFTGVPADSQILMTSFGKQVKQEQVNEIIEATGQDEYIVFCYDRQYLDATPEEISTLLDVEMPSLEPKIQKFDAFSALQSLRISGANPELTLSQTCDRHLSVFTKFDSYSQSLITAATTHTQLAKTIVNEQKSQSMALNVAMINLESHSKAMGQDIQSFSVRAEKELAKQSTLIDAAGVDLDIARSIQIHESIRDIIWIDTSSQVKTRLVDFIDEQRILQVKNETANICNFLTSELRDVRSLATDLKQYEKDLHSHIAEDHNLLLLDTTLADIQEIQTKSQFVRDRINRDLGRIYSKIAELLHVPLSSLFSSLSLSSSQARSSPILPAEGSYTPPPALSSHAKKTLEAFNNLTEIHVNDYLPKLYNYETKIRQKVTDLMSIKRRAIESFLKNINIISQLQSEIAAVKPRLERANERLSDFKEKNNQRDLESAREVLFAYGALMIEVVRRKEYITILVESSNTIADLLARYRAQEEDRREYFRHDVSPSLPFKIQNIGDAAPLCEITAVNENNNNPKIDRGDIIALITLLSQFYSGLRTQNISVSSAKRKPLVKNKRSDMMQSSSHLTKLTRSSNQMSRSMSKKMITRDTHGEKILNLLTTMNSQLDGLKLEFLKSMESAFFLDGTTPNRPSGPPWTGQESSTAAVSEPEYQLQQKTKALSDAEEQLKVYEARINSLERALQQNFKSSMIMAQPGETKRVAVSDQYQLSPRSGSSTSSTYSVVEDDVIKQRAEQAEDTKLKLVVTERKLQALGRERNNMQEEIDRLKEDAKKRDESIAQISKQLAQEQEKVSQSENEKEDMRFQIQELEQLLEDERHTYEENRKSEAQIKDNLADIRIAGVEEDWRDKARTFTIMDDLRSALEERCRINSELLDSNKAEEKRHLEAEQQWQKEKEILSDETEDLRVTLRDLRNKFLELQEGSSKNILQLKDELQRMTREMGDSEQARAEIKHKLSQTRDMVARAETDWMEKHEALEKIMKQQEEIQKTIVDLISQITGTEGEIDEDGDVLALLDILKTRLEWYTVRADGRQQDLAKIEKDYMQIKMQLDELNEERAEWHSLSSQMADKLEQFRKGVLYELTNQLQLSVDEEEAGAMSKKIATGEDQSAAWNEIVQATNGIDTEKFVNRIRKKVKEAHELTRRWHREYKEVKEKNTRLERSVFEKIAFRNFKVGDLALFLPTRNSSGKPWAAFNINAPHFFLKATENVATQMRVREWIVARIVSMSEHVVDGTNSQYNPFGLMEGLKFYELEVEHWRPSHNKWNKSQRRASDRSSASTNPKSSKDSNESAQRSLSSSNTTESLHRRHSLSKAVGTSPDTGLASISMERTKADKLASSVASLPTSSSAQTGSQPYSMSRSSSNIIHSYTPSSSSQVQIGNAREHHRNADYFNRQLRSPTKEFSGIDPTLVWTSPE